MFCKYYNKSTLSIMLIAGVVSLVFGIVSVNMTSENAHNLVMLSGMFVGFGGALTAIGIFRLVRMKISSPEKLKNDEIKRTDERNIQIIRTAAVAAETAAVVLFAIMAFLFVWLGYRTASFISIGAMYVNQLVYFIARRVVSTKM